jgi:hypothetical protein
MILLSSNQFTPKCMKCNTNFGLKTSQQAFKVTLTPILYSRLCGHEKYNS